MPAIEPGERRNVGRREARLGRLTLAAPIGFMAGDVNLYRFIGNSPTNATDPSGLDETIGGPFHANIAFYGDFTETEKQQIRLALREAADRLGRANHALQLHWEDLLERPSLVPGPGGKPFESPGFKRLCSYFLVSIPVCEFGSASYDAQYVVFYRDVLQRAVDELVLPGSTIKFRLDRDREGTMAYVTDTLGIMGDSIYVTDLFFRQPHVSKVGVLIHELGRRQGFNQTGGGGQWDVEEWDKIVEYLANQCSRFVK